MCKLLHSAFPRPKLTTMQRVFRSSWFRWTIFALLLSVLVAFAVSQIAARRARADLVASLESDARLRQVLLASEIARFRLLPLALSDDRDVVAAVHGRAGAAATLNRK
ncbi:hypothetical protein DMC47_15380, partial [Nostoc sp. 3335mG]